MQDTPLIHDIVVDRPSFPYSKKHDLALELYIIVKREVFHDYRAQPDYDRIRAEGLASARDLPIAKLLRGKEMRDGGIMLELCLRYTLNVARRTIPSH